jgi:hypothetical protein
MNNSNKVWKITPNTDATDIDQKCIGLNVSRTDAPVSSHVYNDRGLHIQIRHNRNALTFDLSNDLARLIAAAPEMLEALEMAVKTLTDLEILIKVSNAITKARGES